jgi:polysaccharide biosynthesis protein PslH
MSEILFIGHRIPFPPDRGDKIRSHHILKHLAKLAPVHVATFADDEMDMAEEAELAALASSYKLVRRAKPLVLAGMQAVMTGQPVSLTAFYDRCLADYVTSVIASRPISTIYMFSGQMGQYVPADFAGRIVADFVDVDSAKFAAYAEKRRGPFRWIQNREARLLRQEEARLAAQADVSLLISHAEVKLFNARLSPDERAKASVRVLGNGIDSLSYDPALVTAEPALAQMPAPRLIFTGQMDYAPNIEAAQRVADRILPLIRQSLPDASFHVVGRMPSADLLNRHGRDGFHVWGRVPDIRTWLRASDMAIVPLDIARGVQNKVLEAMAMELPVVLTPGAANGIDATDGQHFAVSESDEALAAAAVALLSDPAKMRAMAPAARKFVVDNASWQAALAPLAEMAGFVGGAARNAA